MKKHTKKHICEAIAFWKKQLRELDESSSKQLTMGEVNGILADKPGSALVKVKIPHYDAKPAAFGIVADNPGGQVLLIPDDSFTADLLVVDWQAMMERFPDPAMRLGWMQQLTMVGIPRHTIWTVYKCVSVEDDVDPETGDPQVVLVFE